jgi:hypothetical protein
MQDQTQRRCHHWPTNAAPFPEDEEDEHDRVTFKFALQIAELVGEEAIGVAVAEAALKITADAYNEHLPPGKKVTTSWYMRRKKAMDAHEPDWFRRDYCNGVSAGKKEHADHLFVVDLEARVCPQCRGNPFDERGHARRASFYYNLEDLIQRQFSSRYQTKAMRSGAQTTAPTDAMEDRVLTDVYDGAILEQAYHDSLSLDRHKVLHLACDGT